MNDSNKKLIVEHITAHLSNVTLIYLFGSMADGTSNDRSDVDVAVLCSQPIDNISVWDCAQSLATKVDRDVDLVNLLSCSTVLAMQIDQTGKLLFGSSDNEMLFHLKTMSMYQHLQDERKQIVNEFYKG